MVEQDAIEEHSPPADAAGQVLFDGDRGTLPLIARKALVLLLKRTHVTALTKPEEWQAIFDFRERITSRLNDLFLELVVDEAREIAYKRQAGQELDGRVFTTLLQNRAYRRDEVALLLHLREVHQRALRDGHEAAFIDMADLIEALQHVRPATIKDHKAADDRARNAVESLSHDGFLLRSPSEDPDRLQISPVIETLLTVERLQSFMDAMYADNQPGDYLTDDGAGEEGQP